MVSFRIRTKEKIKAEITFLSNFSWDTPNVLELLCETASFKSFKINHFSKPSSIFKISRNKSKEYSTPNINILELKNFSIKFSHIPIIKEIQNRYLLHQINKASRLDHLKVLIYNNLDSLSDLGKKLKDNFDVLIYLCADYAKLDKNFLQNCELADCIFIIPNSMHDTLNNRFSDKKLILWPQPVSSLTTKNLTSKQTNKLNEILSKIPKPRLIYAGQGKERLNSIIYNKVASSFPKLSLISFGSKKFHRRSNVFELKSISKEEMLYFISQCQVGFMPYDISDPHNFHCVPLKLFDYFSVGIPVVSSKLINLKEYDDLLYMCNSEREFESAIIKSLQESNSTESRTKRKQVYRYHSSLERSNQFETIVYDLLRPTSPQIGRPIL